MSNTAGGTGPIEPTEPAHIEPAHIEPAHIEPAQVEPAQVEPVEVSPVVAEPTPLDPVAPPFSTSGAVPPVEPVSYAPTEQVAPATAVYASETTPTAAYAPEPVAAPAPIYVQAPEPPVLKGNRGFGALIGLLAALAFGVLYAALIFVWLWFDEPGSVVASALVYYSTAWFIVPVVGFYIGFLLLAVILNRGGWPGWVYGGFVVALITWLAAISGALVDQALVLQADEVVAFVQAQFLALPAILAFIVAREVTIWFGSFVATHGARVKLRNAEAKADYERRLAESPITTV
jgi:hypothetical protein